MWEALGYLNSPMHLTSESSTFVFLIRGVVHFPLPTTGTLFQNGESSVRPAKVARPFGGYSAAPVPFAEGLLFASEEGNVFLFSFARLAPSAGDLRPPPVVKYLRNSEFVCIVSALILLYAYPSFLPGSSKGWSDLLFTYVVQNAECSELSPLRARPFSFQNYSLFSLPFLQTTPRRR